MRGLRGAARLEHGFNELMYGAKFGTTPSL
jgi:hypothetical protein